MPTEAQPQADLSEQPGNSCSKTQLEKQRWPDTGKIQLNQNPCYVCPVAEAFQSPELLSW